MKLESLQSRRTWIIGGLVVALLLVAVSWLMVIHPKLDAASATRAQAANNDFANTQLMVKNSKLAREQRNIAGLRTELAAALAALPATSALPEFTHEVTQVATTDAVRLANIGISALTPVVSAAPATAAPTATSSSSTDAGSGTAAPPATTPATTPATASQYEIAVTLSTEGPLARQLAFLKHVENGERRALITSSSFNGAGDKTTMTTQLNIFTAPMSADQVTRLRKLLTG